MESVTWPEGVPSGQSLPWSVAKIQVKTPLRVTAPLHRGPPLCIHQGTGRSLQQPPATGEPRPSAPQLTEMSPAAGQLPWEAPMTSKPRDPAQGPAGGLFGAILAQNPSSH